MSLVSFSEFGLIPKLRILPLSYGSEDELKKYLWIFDKIASFKMKPG